MADLEDRRKYHSTPLMNTMIGQWHSKVRKLLNECTPPTRYLPHRAQEARAWQRCYFEAVYELVLGSLKKYKTARFLKLMYSVVPSHATTKNPFCLAMLAIQGEHPSAELPKSIRSEWGAVMEKMASQGIKSGELMHAVGDHGGVSRILNKIREERRTKS